MKKEYKWKITLGDWSDDGHGKTSLVHIISNAPYEHIEECYKNSIKMTGFDFAKEVCSEYEMTFIDTDLIKKFREIGMTLEMYDLDLEAYEQWYIDEEGYLELLFEFISLSDKFLEFEIVYDDTPDLIYSGASFGYGLF